MKLSGSQGPNLTKKEGRHDPDIIPNYLKN